MKIAISVKDMHVGGGPKFILNLGEYLAKAGHSVTVVVEHPGEWWSELASRNLSGHVLPSRATQTLSERARTMVRYWQEQQFDAVILNVGARIAHFAIHLMDDRIAVLAIAHGDWEHLYRALKRDLAAWNGAVGVSPRVHQVMASRFPKKPVFSVPNGVEIPTADQLRARADWELPLRMLFVGRLVDHHKGVLRLPVIVAACRRRKLPVTLTVIGDGQDRKALLRMIQKEGVADLVHLTGAVPPSAVADAMRSHHVFLFPTNTEGMPLAVLEAEANGCVVIATRLAGITDVAVQDRITGRLTDLGNIDQFVDAIADMTDPKVWRAHSQAGIELAARSFSISTMGEGYVRILEELIAETHSSRPPLHRTGIGAAEWWEDFHPALLWIAKRLRVGLMLRILTGVVRQIRGPSRAKARVPAHGDNCPGK